jgi:hypothetical protein
VVGHHRNPSRTTTARRVALTALTLAAIAGTVLFCRPPRALDDANPGAADASAGVLRQERPDPLAEGAGRTEVLRRQTPGPRVRITFVDHEGARIPSVALSSSSSRSVWRDSTSVEGECVVSDASVFGGRVRASAVGYRDRQFELPTPPEGEASIVVMLESERVIRGCVQWSNGPTARSQIRVIAWLANSTPDRASLRESSSGQSSGIESGETDDRGCFAIRVSSHPELYYVSAYGEGGICLTRAVPNRSGDAGVLTLKPLWGACVRLIGAEGQPILTSPRLFARGASWSCDDDRLSPLLSSTIELQLLLATEAWNEDESGLECDLRRKLLLFTGDAELERSLTEKAGPVQYTVHVPGYEPFNSAFTVTRLPAGPQEIELKLTRSAVGWGSVVCRLAPPAALAIGERSRQPVAIVQLWRANGDDDGKYEFAATFGETRVDGVPEGRYRIVVKSLDWYHVLPATGLDDDILVVERGCESVVEPLAADLGAIELDLVGERTGPYSGPAVIEVSGHVNGRLVQMYAQRERGPYRLELMPPGTYDLTVSRLSARYAKQSGSIRVDVAAGETSVAGVVISDG